MLVNVLTNIKRPLSLYRHSHEAMAPGGRPEIFQTLHNKIMYSIKVVDEKVVVSTPYSSAFVDRARVLGGKWSGDAWEFPVRDLENVRALMQEVYGTDGSHTQTTTARVTVLGYMYQNKGPIMLYGRPVASARGRDTGAKIGEGVAFISGRPKSGGSVKNWHTEIDQGAIFEVRDLPIGVKDLPKRKLETDGKISIEFIDDTIDKIQRATQLQAEIDRLRRELDTLLGS